MFVSMLLPKAYLITPNQFEAEKLTETSITDMPSLFSVVDKLHDCGPKIVVITSTNFNEDNQEFIDLYGSNRVGLDIGAKG
mmetsp:Transcript_37082/g.56902  ORF Transcript_37082/g.56902 Transcript_37082/m.56902 type:complete len:81 (+) Transcript_37082:211-453(+)